MLTFFEPIFKKKMNLFLFFTTSKTLISNFQRKRFILREERYLYDSKIFHL